MSTPTLRWIPSVLASDERQRAVAALSTTERARFDYEPLAKRETFLAGRHLLRSLAGDLLGLDAADVPLIASCPDCHREHGRPLIEGTDLHVSLAHSADAVVAVAAWGARVGVDLEPAGTKVDNLAPLIRTPSLHRWTRIEAVLKADGRGLRVSPDLVEFATTSDGDIGWVPGAPARYRVWEVDLDPAVRVSIALELNVPERS